MEMEEPEPPEALEAVAALVVMVERRALPITCKGAVLEAVAASSQKAEMAAIVVYLARAQLLAPVAAEACLMAALRDTGGAVAPVAPEW